MRGEIPSELGVLSKLEYLYLWNNQLSGTIPAEIFRLDSLRVVQLDQNLLTGHLSSHIAMLASLLELELFGNQFTGTVCSIVKLGVNSKLYPVLTRILSRPDTKRVGDVDIPCSSFNG